MKFLVDQHLSPKLCVWLAAQGHDAVHVSVMPLGARTPDSDIIAKADAEDRVIVSKDADFVNSLLITGRPKRLLAIKIGNTSNAVLVAELARYLDDIVIGLASAAYVELRPGLLVLHSGSGSETPE